MQASLPSTFISLSQASSRAVEEKTFHASGLSKRAARMADTVKYPVVCASINNMQEHGAQTDLQRFLLTEWRQIGRY